LNSVIFSAPQFESTADPELKQYGSWEYTVAGQE
jgi:hypothetical protein